MNLNLYKSDLAKIEAQIIAEYETHGVHALDEQSRKTLAFQRYKKNLASDPEELKRGLISLMELFFTHSVSHAILSAAVHKLKG